MRKTVNEWIEFFESDDPWLYGIDKETADKAVEYIKCFESSPSGQCWFPDLFHWRKTDEGDAFWAGIDEMLDQAIPEPIVTTTETIVQDRITRRDYFAAAALQGLLATAHIRIEGQRMAAIDAVKLADDLIAALEKEK